MEWFTSSWDRLGLIALSAVSVYAILIVYTRVNGLRTFSKMSSFDFAMTIAVGSMMASSILTKDPSVPDALVGLGALYLCQRVVSLLRVHVGLNKLVDNEPLVLMAGEEIFDDALRKARITRDDLYSKLREANVLEFAQVRAVVFETTGDMSVLHGDPDGPVLDEALLHGVRGKERVTTKPSKSP